MKFAKKIPLYQMLLKIKDKYSPQLPSDCLVPVGRYDYNLSVSSNQIIPEEFFWGPFYPPAGLYKFSAKGHTTKEPEEASGQWVTEIKPRKGVVGEVEW
jgi:hypothetical protein